jgi:hypothetical protein
MVRPPVQEHERRTGARRRHVEPEITDLDSVVLGTR